MTPIGTIMLAAESLHPRRIGWLDPTAFVFSLSAKRVSDKLPQMNSVQ